MRLGMRLHADDERMVNQRKTGYELMILLTLSLPQYYEANWSDMIGSEKESIIR